MRCSAISTLAFAAGVLAQSKSAGSPPAGCSTTCDGKFTISTVNVSSSSTKRSIEARQDGSFTIQLANSVLTDSQNRIADIVANKQFQFDPAPGQAGYIYNAGFSVCQNGTLAVGPTTIFYACPSGGFANLYTESIASYCYPVYIQTSGSGSCSGGSSSSNSGSSGSPMSSMAVSQVSDGQPQQATSAATISQVSDGQPQAATSAMAVSQISDGQVQQGSAMTTSYCPESSAMPVGQISDGQVQQSSAAVSQISDGQVQAAPTPAPVSQISDGQVQAPTGAPASQISDGQVQAPAGTGNAMATGTMSAPSGTGSPIAYTGAANVLNVASAGIFGIFGLALAL